MSRLYAVSNVSQTFFTAQDLRPSSCFMLQGKIVTHFASTCPCPCNLFTTDVTHKQCAHLAMQLRSKVREGSSLSFWMFKFRKYADFLHSQVLSLYRGILLLHYVSPTFDEDNYSTLCTVNVTVSSCSVIMLDWYFTNEIINKQNILTVHNFFASFLKIFYINTVAKVL